MPGVLHAKPDLRLFLKWMIYRSGSVIVTVILPSTRNAMHILPYILILIGFPVVPIVVHLIRHSPENTKSGVGTQHIVLTGLLIQMLFVGSGIGLLIATRF